MRFCLTCESLRQFGGFRTSCTACTKQAKVMELHLRNHMQELDLKAQFLSMMPPRDRHAHSDVVLVASDDASSRTPILAHKVVLASRSPVFKAMFENDMLESQSGTVNISEVSHNVLRAFVNFLYMGEMWLTHKMARDLLVLAERYQVKYVKTYCEKFLLSQLKWEKAISMYVFAHQYNAKELLDAAFKLIEDNIDKFTEHSEYESMVENNPRVVIEIYEAYLSKIFNF